MFPPLEEPSLIPFGQSVLGVGEGGRLALCVHRKPSVANLKRSERIEAAKPREARQERPVERDDATGPARVTACRGFQASDANRRPAAAAGSVGATGGATSTLAAVRRHAAWRTSRAHSSGRACHKHRSASHSLALAAQPARHAAPLLLGQLLAILRSLPLP